MRFLFLIISAVLSSNISGISKTDLHCPEQILENQELHYLRPFTRQGRGATGSRNAVPDSAVCRLIPYPVIYMAMDGHATQPLKKIKIHKGRRVSRQFRAITDTLPEFARKEAYRLTLLPGRARIEALTDEGVFRAQQTLRQLFLLEPAPQCCTITDWPRFAHRGIMIDESRSFKGVDFLKRQIDAMALLKLNTLHLHLTDAAGWRIEIKSHPELTQKAAWRIGRIYSQWEKGGYAFSTPDDPRAYGGFYTQDELCELVEYASRRHINIIPEIEMPGHSMEVNRTYPEIACLDSTGRRRNWAWDLCPGNEGTFALLEDVLDEVMDIFPSRYIHIGGDEAAMKDWPECINCRSRMREEGYTGVHQLQGYLVRRMAGYLAEHGRAAIGWDEILDTGVPSDAVIQSWRGPEGGIRASAAGHDVVMSPTTHCYFDYYQDLIRKEPSAVGELVSLRRVYSFEPTEGISPGARSHVLGLQANLWCEKIPTPEHAEYMLYPRAFAIAERGWSEAGVRDYDAFRLRARALLNVFRNLGYNTFDMDTESPRALSRCWERTDRRGFIYLLQEDGAVLSRSLDCTVPILIEDGWGFRDMNSNGALDPFEDWRLSASGRAADLKRRLDAGEALLLEESIRSRLGEEDLEVLFAQGVIDNPYGYSR